MQPITDITPATANNPATIDTGAAVANAITVPPDAAALQAFALANLRHLEATAARYRAEQAEAEAHANAYRADPYMSQAERVIMSTYADNRATNIGNRAHLVEIRANEMRSLILGATAEPPIAVIVVTVQRDQIKETARLIMGGTHTVSRTWARTGADSWRSRDRDWSAAEDRIGVELCEFMESMRLPDRIANMLPRPASTAARKAALEVSNA